jgi:signal transduction histidine kinase
MAVSLVTMATLFWLLAYRERRYLAIILDNLTITVFWLDLLLSVLLTGAVLLLGQAIIAYEIFTGKALPTQGLRRQWHNAIMLAGGYSLAVGGTLALQLPGVYVILPATLLIILALALFGRRVYWERERDMAALRPFVASEQVYDSVLISSEVPLTEAELRAPFVALARDLLKVKLAYLFPVGGFSSLAAPLSYPAPVPPVLSWDKILPDFASSEEQYLPLDPEVWQGAIWALPLRNSRGMIGLLLLGEKQDGGLFSQEEMEIARAGGERLLDNTATAHLAQRLMALQRQRFVTHQVLDQQSRRTLHDEILPNLHTALLNLSGEAGDLAKAREQLAEAHRRISALLREMPAGSDSQVGKVGLLKALRQMPGREFAADFAEINWQIDPEAERRAGEIPALSGEVIFYAAKEIVRNAAHHGRGEAAGPPLSLQISANWTKGLELRIADNGVGLPESAAGGGQGLALHGAMLAVIGGSLALVNRPDGGGTVAVIVLPASLWGSWSNQA